MMDSQRYQRLKAVFQKVIAAEPADRRSATVQETSGENEDLRRDLDELLRHAESPAVDLEREALLLDQSIVENWNPKHPERIGPYQILSVLGEGGMGIVYLAEQERPRRKVALKVLRLVFATPRMIRRFEFEAEVLGRLKHQNIAQIYEAGVADIQSLGQVAYFAMEHVQGRALREYIRSAGPSIAQRLALMIEIARAVDHAHRQGVIHRDLKPANIVMDESSVPPVPKVLDFGIARLVTEHQQDQVTLLTHAGEFMGTLPYMSPEHVSGATSAIDARADVYSLGVIFFEMMVNRLPIDVAGRSLHESVRNIGEAEPARLTSFDRRYRGDLDTIAGKALEKDIDRRYQSAGALADDLERFLSNEPIAARPATRVYCLRKFAHRNRAMVGGVVMVLLALLTGVVATVFKAREAQAQHQRAEAESLASRQISEFLHDVLTAVDPLKATAERPVRSAITVREALDQASPRMDEIDQSAPPRVRASLHRTIGLAYRAVGEHARAESHLRSAHRLLGEELGADHDDTLAAANELVLVLADLRRLDEARELAAASLEIANARMGSSETSASEVFARLMASSGIVAYWSGDLATAERFQRQHLQFMIQQHGDSHRMTLISKSNLGLTLTDLGLLAEAAALLEEVATFRAQTLGGHHVETLFARNNLAKLLQRQGRLDLAAAHWDAIVERGRASLGPIHPEWQAWLRNLALSHALQGDVARGIELLQSSREHLMIDGPDTHPSTIHHIGMLAMFLLEAGQLEEARPIIDQVHDLSVQVFGQDHIETVRSLTLYYDLYEKLGDAAEMRRIAGQLQGTPFDPAAKQ